MYCVGYADEIRIGNVELSVIKKNGEYHDIDSPDTIKLIYKKGGRDTINIHYFNSEGDSNSKGYTFGTYITTDTSIIVYTYWCKAGDIAYYPFGARVQEYTVNNNGKFTMVNSRLYVEACSQYYRSVTGHNPDCDGVDYLFTTPKTKEEKEKFKKYIQRAEKEYKAKFVYGKQSDELLEEIREIFQEEIKKYTYYWYGNMMYVKK